MGHKKRTYKIVEAVTGGPPQGTPVLGNDDGDILSSEELIFNKNQDDMKKVDHYRIRFDILDFSDSRLRFVPDKLDVMWAQKGTEADCPTSRCELPGVFWVDDVDKDGEWIDVINMDMEPLRFQFTLNFVDKTISNPTPDDYVPLDPGGGNENGGGPGSGFTLNTFVVLAFGFAAGLVAFFGARLFFAGW